MLTFQFVPYVEIEGLSEDDKLRKLIDIVKAESIVLLEGKLNRKEEAELIKKTMEEIDDKFRGVEISVISSEKKISGFMGKVKGGLADMLLGERQGLTIIGPATIIKEIKKDPHKIQLLIEESRKGIEKSKGKKKRKR
ncbi:MAG: DUF2073 domain-containing protein [bacterium]|nr:DUF2073 domain-containing protein [bacterium]